MSDSKYMSLGFGTSGMSLPTMQVMRQQRMCKEKAKFAQPSLPVSISSTLKNLSDLCKSVLA